MGSRPGVGCEIVAGVRAAGVTRGWGRTNPEPDGPHPNPAPSRCRHPGAGKPQKGREALGLTRKRLEDPNRPVPVGVNRQVGEGVLVWSYFSRRSLDRSLRYAEPYGHPVHGDSRGAGSDEFGGDLGGGLPPGAVRQPVGVPRSADALVDVGGVWLLVVHTGTKWQFPPDGTGALYTTHLDKGGTSCTVVAYLEDGPTVYGKGKVHAASEQPSTSIGTRGGNRDRDEQRPARRTVWGSVRFGVPGVAATGVGSQWW